jgi:hypothetical protein
MCKELELEEDIPISLYNAKPSSILPPSQYMWTSVAPFSI